MIEEKFQQQDALINQMQSDNTQLSLGLQKKDEENRQLAQVVQQLELKVKKYSSSAKNSKHQKKEIKEKDKELHKLRKEVIDLKHQNQSLNSAYRTAKDNQVVISNRPIPQRLLAQKQNNQQNENTNSAYTANLQNDNRRLEIMVQSLQTKEYKANQNVKSLEEKLKAKSDECVVQGKDLVKFKQLSEGYMNDIARLEA